MDWRQLGVLSTTLRLPPVAIQMLGSGARESSGGAVKSDEESIGFEMQPPDTMTMIVVAVQVVVTELPVANQMDE